MIEPIASCVLPPCPFPGALSLPRVKRKAGDNPGELRVQWGVGRKAALVSLWCAGFQVGVHGGVGGRGGEGA